MQRVTLDQHYKHVGSGQFDYPERFFTLSKEQQETLVAWCQQFEAIKKINPSHTSYGLKHVFQDSAGGFSVSNGAFKGAMIEAGFLVDDPDKVNWCFNISKKSVMTVWDKAYKR